MKLGRNTIGTVAYLGGVPALLEGFVWSWTQLIQYNSLYLCGPGEEIRYERSKLSYHASARNELAKNMRGDWLFMLDADHAFEADILARMLNQMERLKVDVLSALYVNKAAPHEPQVYHWGEEQNLYARIVKWDTDDRIFRADAVGAGTLLIKRSVFDRIERELGEGPFSIMPPFSEDLSFCRRLMKLDIPLFVDPHIESLHLASYGVNYSMTPVEDLAVKDVLFRVEAR